MKPSQQIIHALGEDFFVQELGLTERNLRHAKSVGQFAAHWFAAIDDACKKSGVPCPREAFNFKSPANDSGKPVVGKPLKHECNGSLR